VANADRIRNRSKTRAQAARPARRDDYWTLSTRPLHALVFLLPLVVLYEVGSFLYLKDMTTGARTTVLAENMLRVFLENMGVLGLLVPGLSVITVLLVWHVVSKDRWGIKPVVVLGMHLESALWAVPLLVVAAILSHARASGLAALDDGAPLACLRADGVAQLSLAGRATISIGAGIYEELVFRMAGLAACHALLAGLLGVRDAWAKGLSIALTAIAFAFYHDGVVLHSGVSLSQWLGFLASFELSSFITAVRWGAVLFYLIAGVFFAAIYLSRGFGVVVGTHAAYDLAVLVFLAKS
jgi:hypothetical protein